MLMCSLAAVMIRKPCQLNSSISPKNCIEIDKAFNSEKHFIKDVQKDEKNKFFTLGAGWLVGKTH